MKQGMSDKKILIVDDKEKNLYVLDLGRLLNQTQLGRRIIGSVIMTRKLAFFIFSILILGLFFTSCDNKSSSRRSIVKLTYWPSSNPQEIELARVQLEEWNKNHPRIQVSMRPLPDDRPAEEIILAAIVDGSPPDVCSNIWPGAVPLYIEAGGLMAIDKFEDFREVVGSRSPQQMISSLRYQDGHIYQVPWKGNPIMIQFNSKLLREANIKKAPSSYSEFLEAAQQLTKDKDGDGKIDQWAMDPYPTGNWGQRLFDFYPFYIAASGGLTLLRNGVLDIGNNNVAVRVFDFWAEGYKKNYFPKISTPYDAFLKEEVAFHITGPWNISYTEKNKPEGFAYDIIPIPTPDDYSGPVYTYRDSKNISIFKNTSHPREAWEFVKFLINKENDLRLLMSCSQIPLRKDLLTDPEFTEYFQGNPMMEKFVAQAVFTREVDSSPQFMNILEIISQQFMISAIQGKKSSQQAIIDAYQKANEIIGGS